MAQDIGQARLEVEGAREELAETVEAIAYKVNVRRRLKDRFGRRPAQPGHGESGTSTTRGGPRENT
jgi:hypothetical protein